MSSSVELTAEQGDPAPATTPDSLLEQPTPSSQNPRTEQPSITIAFENLELTNLPGDPTTHTLLAHNGGEI